MPIIKKPKKRIAHEAKFHSAMMRWLQYNLDKFPTSFKIETKVVRPGSKNFPFKELSAKEERLLLKAKHGSVLQTNSDEDRRGTNCDGDCVSGGGFIFLQWVRPKNKTFYVIDIEDFIKARDTFKTSLDEKTAMIIAYLVGELK